MHANFPAAAALFTYQANLDTKYNNCVSAIYFAAGTETYEADYTVPSGAEKYVVGINMYTASSNPDELSGFYMLDYENDTVRDRAIRAASTADAAASDVAAVSSAAQVDEFIKRYQYKMQFDELCASTPSAWTDGQFDKAKLVFTVDDGRTDAGYVAQFLSSEYGFPMCFAIPYSSIGYGLIQSYEEDNGDGTTTTYECGFDKLSALLLAEEEFGGETYAHDCSKGRWMLSVDGEGLVPKFDDRMAEYYFIEIKKALEDLGLEVLGFVSPWHDNLDCYAPIMTRYFKYARRSTRSYPNLPYQVSYVDNSALTLEQWKARVDEAVANRSLLMVYTHGIGQGVDFKMKDLKAQFDYVKEKVDAGLMDVTTLRAMYRQRQQG